MKLGKFEHIRDIAGNYAVVKDDYDNYSIIKISNGKTVVKEDYDNISLTSDGYAIVEKNRKYGVIKVKNGKELVKTKYEYLSYLSDGLFAATKSSGDYSYKYGVINAKGKTVFKFGDNYVSSYSNGAVLTNMYCSTYMIDSNGDILAGYDYINDFANGYACAVNYNDPDKYYLIDSSGNLAYTISK